MRADRLIGFLRYAIHGESAARPRRRRKGRRGPARNWRYRAWIRTLPSVASGLQGVRLIEAAHTGDDGGMAQKASDYTCVPLTWEEHAEYHRIGRRAFEQRHNVDFQGAVRELNHAWFAHAAEVK